MLKLGKLTNNYVSSNGNPVFVYTVEGTTEEIKEYTTNYELDGRKVAKTEDGKGVLFFGLEPELTGKSLAWNKGKSRWYVQQDLAAQAKQNKGMDAFMQTLVRAQKRGLNGEALKALAVYAAVTSKEELVDMED